MQGSNSPRRVARILVPGQLIFYRNNTSRAGRNIPGALCVFSGLHDPAQQDLAVIAIDNDRRTLSDSIVSQRALDLGHQKGVVSALGRRLVVMMRLKADTVVACRDGTRFY